MGKQIGFMDYEIEVYELRDYDSKDWIIKYRPGIMNNPSLMVSTRITDINEIPEEFLKKNIEIPEEFFKNKSRSVEIK